MVGEKSAQSVKVGKYKSFEEMCGILTDLVHEKTQAYQTDWEKYVLPELIEDNKNKSTRKKVKHIECYYVLAIRQCGVDLYNFKMCRFRLIGEMSRELYGVLHWVNSALGNLFNEQESKCTIYVLNIQDFEIFQIADSVEALQNFKKFVMDLANDVTNNAWGKKVPILANYKKWK